MVERAPTERASAAISAALFLAIGALIGSDLVADAVEGAGQGHLTVEAVVAGLSAVGAVVALRLWLGLRRDAARLAARADALEGETRELRGEAEQLRTKLVETWAAAERWRGEARQLLEGLGSAIDRQFERWALSPAEREIGLLLLKGLTHQQIAELRGVSEATVRQQARSLYRKAGLEGRADLAAYFLEDLMLPSAGAPSERSAP